jgi:hypothetical protein
MAKQLLTRTTLRHDEDKTNRRQNERTRPEEPEQLFHITLGAVVSGGRRGAIYSNFLKARTTLAQHDAELG